MCRIAPNQSINRSWFARLPLLWMQYTLFLYARFQLFVALGAGLVGLFCPHFQHPTFFTFFIPFWLLALVFSCLSCFGWLFLSFSTLVLECFFHFFLSFLTAVFVRRESMLKSWLEPLMKQQRLLSMVDTYSLTRMRLLSLDLLQQSCVIHMIHHAWVLIHAASIELSSKVVLYSTSHHI